MHKADIDRLEFILTNPMEIKRRLKLKELELEHNASEEIPFSALNNDLQDPRTIRSGGVSSNVETLAIKRSDNLEYKTLSKMINGIEELERTLDGYEKIVYDYRYRRIDLGTFEWDHIAMKLTDQYCEEGKTFGRTTTLKVRDKMLRRFGDIIGHVFM